MIGEIPAHRSFSQLSTFLRCQHSYYLGKVAQVPERPAVYLAAGNAVHSMIESLNHEIYQRMQGVRGE
jgi:ATP-dependent helicase/DNAse subunit B